MTEKLSARILWLDDDPDHETDANNLAKIEKGLDVVFLKPEQFEDFIKGKILKKGEIDLYLIDDRLFKSKSDKLLKGRGFSYAAVIREKNPEVPIYLFSAMKYVDGIFGGLSEAAQSLGDCRTNLKEILRNGSSFLYHDALDYKSIKSSKRKDIRAMFSLLKAPKSEYKKISFALPTDLKSGISSTSNSEEKSSGNSIAFAKWVRRKLLFLPGFLYDSLYSATKIGISEKLFLEKAGLFKEAEYAGIFSKSLPNKLWWNSKLETKIFEIASKELGDSSSTDIREISRKYFKLEESDLPKCAVCGGIYPETVGISKHSQDKSPVHYRCSFPSLSVARELYFDEIREYESEG